MSSDEGSPPAVNPLQERIIQGMTVKSAPTTQYEIKQQALLRDGCKCVVTGVIDYDAWRQLGLGKMPEKPMSMTQVAYLFSESAQHGSKVSVLTYKVW